MRSILRPLFAAAVLAAMITPALHAQNPIIGFKLGPSFSTMTSDPDEGQKSITKFTGGGFVRFDMGGIALQPELMYVTKGARFEETEGGQTAELELRLDYIEIPVLLVLPFAAGGSVSPHVYAGPAFAFEVGCTVALTAGSVNASVDCDGDDEDWAGNRRKFDVGAMVGGGLSIPMGPGSLLLEGRYNFGLLNFNDDSNDDTTVRHRSGAVLAGYSIPIGRRY